MNERIHNFHEMKNLLILILALSCFSVNAQKKSSKKMEGTTLTGKKEDAPKIITYQPAEKKAAQVNDFQGILKITDSRNIGFAGTFLIKESNVAGEMPLSESTTSKSIIDNQASTIIVLNEKKKVAVKTRRVAHQRDYTPANADGTPAKKTVITVTKETKTISGFVCTKVIGDDGYTRIEAWVAPELKFNLSDLLPTASGTHLIRKINKDGLNGMIMKMNSYDTASGKSFNLNVTAEAKKVKNKSFKIPKGYKIVDHTNIVGTSRPAPSVSSFGDIRKKAFAAQKKMNEAKAAGAATEGGEEAPTEKSAPAKEKE